MTITRTRDLDRVWNDFFYGGKTEYNPVYDAIENDNHYELIFELPGVEEKNIYLEVKDKILKLEVKGEASNKNNKIKYLVKNRNEMEFVKSFKLPEDVDNDKVSADLRNGLLTLKINKKEETKPKKIEIRS